MVLSKRRSKRKPRKPLRPTRSGFEEQGALNPAGDGVHSGAIFEIGEDVRFSSANARRVSLHHFEAGADIRSKVNLVDHQKAGVGDARTSFSGNLVAFGDVDDIDRGI